MRFSLGSFILGAAVVFAWQHFMGGTGKAKAA